MYPSKRKKDRKRPHEMDCTLTTELYHTENQSESGGSNLPKSTRPASCVCHDPNNDTYPFNAADAVSTAAYCAHIKTQSDLLNRSV
ncbi:MAG: hypothetical protein LBI03_05420 [Clostridiales bacterium]|nr:hypothetical protein [Clostridiales bacterium]